MRIYITIILFALTMISCGKERTISEELEGEWVYERETFSSFTTFEDLDTKGTITFREDETGEWRQALGFSLGFNLEWDLQADDTKIAITKNVIGQQFFFPSTGIFDITRTDEDNFRFTSHIKIESVIDTIETFEQFENLILTRIN